MSNRVDAQNFYNDKIDMNRIEAFLRKKRNSNIKNLSFLHIVIAAIVRTISQRPGLNRFVAGQKIYARNEILISLAIKKELREDSPETTVKIKFEPTDTLYDVVAKVNEAIENNKKEDVKNDTDKTARIIMLCPGFLVKFFVWIVSKLDYFGLMPKIFNRVSPFHTSVFVTDLGSLGIPPVYHHLYNFGTTSIFVAFGAKQKEKIVNKDNNIVERKYVPVKIVTDERIADGHYFASAFKLFKRILNNPEQLETPPKQVFEDIE